MKRYFFVVPLIAILVLWRVTGAHAQEHQPPRGGIFEVYFDDIDEPQSRISLGIRHKINSKQIGRYAEKKDQKGVYFRTQFNVLICEEDPCEQRWSAAFVYTDDGGTTDTIGLTWRQVVFSGITPKGTIKRELTFCVNKKCINLEDPKDENMSDKPQTGQLERYHVTWSRYSLLIGRSDGGK